jgi:hypothetical protein
MLRSAPIGDEALHRRRLVAGVAIDDEKDGLIGADQEPLEERAEDVRINRSFMDHEAEIAAQTDMMPEKVALLCEKLLTLS